MIRKCSLHRVLILAAGRPPLAAGSWQPGSEAPQIATGAHTACSLQPHAHQSSAKVVMSKMLEEGPMQSMKVPSPAADQLRGAAK
jgi:hypothetical protein